MARKGHPYRDPPTDARIETLIAAEQNRANVAEQRLEWRAAQAHIDSRQVVFIDETSAKANKTRTYGRSSQGSRLIEKRLAAC